MSSCHCSGHAGELLVNAWPCQDTALGPIFFLWVSREYSCHCSGHAGELPVNAWPCQGTALGPIFFLWVSREYSCHCSGHASNYTRSVPGHASDLSIITSSHIATTQATHDSAAAAEAGHAG